MKPVKDGGPAFPTSVSADSLGGLNHGLPGMTLRDYFAAAAMQGICAAFRDVPADVVGAAPGISEDAYRIADAMLAERERAR